MPQPTDSGSLLAQWLTGIRIAQIAHSRAAARYRLAGRLLGIPVTVFSVVVGTGIFASLSASDNQRLLIAAGAISLIAAVLAGVQTFLNYPELAAQHHQAAAKYGRLRRTVEEAIAVKPQAELAALTTEFREEWCRIEEESPPVPQNLHDAAHRAVSPKGAAQAAGAGQ